ncbi:hypothetical protein VZQ01_18815 [Myxococcus faecalis]|uniref:hypothetical protein n=1 Tax=Myxococcus TaxID=32 RepID=UPI001E37CE36|nr:MULTISPECIES: hypothetical protein [Myxococcus]MCK8499976.1 hypothetical protein [Myxococcus fulvus]
MQADHDTWAPRRVDVPLASAVNDYLLRIQQLGAVEGPGGAVGLNPALEPVLEALHHLLAGGEVEVRVTRRGHASLVHELRQRVEDATREVNLLQQVAGSSLTTTV